MPPTVDQLVAGIARHDRALLARAISLVESQSPRHTHDADQLLASLAPRLGHATRIGITGVPGAGKSTFIERLGLLLADRGHRVAVLAIDPSSVVTGGSILGDRTRMARLAAHPNAYIRPSPSDGSLGGVARRTREAALVCEAAGFDVILIETVGVGQSETSVAHLVDAVLTLALPNAGDELQGVKRGLLEVVDVIAVNKADGDHAPRARHAAAELASALRVLRHGEDIPVLTCSAATGDNITGVWDRLRTRVDSLRASGALEARRRDQAARWLHSVLDERLHALLHESPAAAAELDRAEREVRAMTTSPRAAAERVLTALGQGLSPANTAQAANGSITLKPTEKP